MRAVWQVLAVWLAGLGAAGQFGKVSVGWDALSAQWAGLSPVVMGLAVSVVGLVGLAFGVLAGEAVARIGPRRALVAALAAGGAVSAVQAAGLAPGAFLALRVVEGVSHLAIVVAGPVAISAVAAGRWQGAAMTLWSSFFGLAYALLAVVGPPVLAAGGLAGLFLGHGVWMAGCAALVARLLPADPPAGQGGGGARRLAGGVLARHRAIYADPRLSGPALGFVFYTAAYVALLTLVPPLLPAAARAPVAAAMPLISIAVSLSFGIWVLRFVPAVGLAGAAYGAGLAGAVLFAFAPVSGALVLSAALGLAQGAHFAAIPQLNAAPADRARAAGAIAQMGNLGTVTGTPVLAVLLAALGPGAVPAFAGALCAGGLAVHVLLAARRRNLAAAG